MNPTDSDTPGRFHTVAKACRHEIDKIRGSRFLAEVAPASSADEALEHLARLRREYHDARHHCWAYRLAPDGTLFRSSDDGEPSGSAGKPILQQLQGSGLVDAIVVVVRYFGGTKLGVGGLVRAYGDAAAAVLERAARRQVIRRKRLVLRYPYEATAFVQRLCDLHEIEMESAVYGEGVEQAVQVPLDAERDFLGALDSGGVGRIHVSDA